MPGSLEISRGNKKSFGLSVLTFFDARTGKDICVNRYETIFKMNQTICSTLKRIDFFQPKISKGNVYLTNIECALRLFDMALS